MKLLRIVYTSEASEDFSETDLVKLVNQAFNRNRTRGITGVMYYRKRRFIQCLEGPDGAVIPLYANIMQDSRHGNVVTVVIKPVAERLFPDWSMGLINRLDEEVDLDTLLEAEIGSVGAWNEASWAEILESFRAAEVALSA